MLTKVNLQDRMQQLMDERTDCAVAHVYIRAGHDVNEHTARTMASRKLAKVDIQIGIMFPYVSEFGATHNDRKPGKPLIYMVKPRKGYHIDRFFKNPCDSRQTRALPIYKPN